jgi:hypothetical protein
MPGFTKDRGGGRNENHVALLLFGDQPKELFHGQECCRQHAG